MALVTLLLLKMKIRGGGSATRVDVDSKAWSASGLSYTDMIVWTLGQSRVHILYKWPPHVPD